MIGIWLFNWDIGKGGVGLESFSEIIEHPAWNLINDLNEEIADIMESSDNYTIFFNVMSEIEDKIKLSKSEITMYKDELTYKW